MGLRPGKTKGPWVGPNTPPIPPDFDEKVKATATDTTTNYLANKLVAGANINLTLLSPGGNEQIGIASTAVAVDELVKVTAADTTTSYLDPKVTAGRSILKTVLLPAGNESLNLEYRPVEQALVDAPVIAVDNSLADVMYVTLAASRTMGLPAFAAPGVRLTFRVAQDLTGGWTLAWSPGYRFSSSLPAPVLSAAPGAEDYLGFIYNGVTSTWDYVAEVKGF